MGFKNWVRKKVADKILKQVSTYFANGAELKVLVDSKIAEDYSQQINEALGAFAGIASVKVERADVSGCWNGARGQYNLESLIRTPRTAWTLYILKEDIYVKPLNWAYGITAPLAGFSSVSMARFSNSETAKKLGLIFTEQETKAQLVVEIRHEVGHLLGLKDHPEGKHVGNCAMNQTMHMKPPGNTENDANVPENAENAANDVFCAGCHAQIVKFNEDVQKKDLTAYAEALTDLVFGM